MCFKENVVINEDRMYSRIKIINEVCEFYNINRIKEIYVCLWKGKVEGTIEVKDLY